MPKFPEKTLAYWLNNAVYGTHDFHGVTTKQFVAKVNEYMKDQDNKSPEEEAVRFYLLNHLVSVLRAKKHVLEPLDAFEDVVMEEYTSLLFGSGLRAVMYLIQICVQEARHGAQRSTFKGTLEEKGHSVQYPENCFEWYTGCEGVSQWKQSPPDVQLIDFCRFVPVCFSYGIFGSSFGGQPWANVAECLNGFVSGKYSVEVLMDTIWTLAHNTGPIFNKGYLYHHQDNDKLAKLLDVQRSGQMPALKSVGHFSSLSSSAVIKGLWDRVSEFADRYPEEVSTDFDYMALANSNPLGSWPELEEKLSSGSTGSFMVMPGVVVPIFSRKEAA